MAISDNKPTRRSTDRRLSKWEEWREAFCFGIIVMVSSIVLWDSPTFQPIGSLILLGIGLFFDVISLVARISTAITGKFSSGFFFVGFIFYLWAWISYSHPVMLGEADGLFSLWLRKLPDILCMGVIHLLIHLWPDRDREEPETETTKSKSQEKTAD